MPRLGHLPLTLFSLDPLNDQARDVFAHPNNRHLTSTSLEGNQTLDIGFYLRPTSRNTLATLGRCESDITLEGACISRFQCSFEIINLRTDVIMLYDRSNSQTTQVFGENAVKFEPGRLRRIVVAPYLNTKIGMGGRACNFIQFRLLWHKNINEVLREGSVRQLPYELENPCLAPTVDEEPTAAPTRLGTEFHTPGKRMSMRYNVGHRLGAGTFGEVYRALDIDSGNIMAVKIIKRPMMGWDDRTRKNVRREAAALERISHPHIIQYIASNWTEEDVKIFMDLKEGSVEKLIGDGRLQTEPKLIASNLLSHMLQALDFLAYNDIVHRDVKPANILYTRSKDGYLFQLTDFGTCNLSSQAVTSIGTTIYMAPEMFVSGAPQTSKISAKTSEDRLKAIFAAAKSPILGIISEMAIRNADKRASAAQMLVKLYSGKGLTTPGFRPPPHDFPPTISSKMAIQNIPRGI